MNVAVREVDVAVIARAGRRPDRSALVCRTRASPTVTRVACAFAGSEYNTPEMSTIKEASSSAYHLSVGPIACENTSLGLTYG